jgi:hypothetical protein
MVSAAGQPDGIRLIPVRNDQYSRAHQLPPSGRFPHNVRDGSPNAGFEALRTRRCRRAIEQSIRLLLHTTQQTRVAVEAWLQMLRTTHAGCLFPSRLHARFHQSTRQYARLVHCWVESVGLEPALYGTHSMRGTKARLGLNLQNSRQYIVGECPSWEN